ncbi:MAG: dodecin family protein [Gammaproteobacteria bacterium]
MQILKVVEVLAQSNQSWEDAAQTAVQETAKTVRQIKSIYISDLEATVENGRITNYRINAKISFVLEGH